MSDQRTLFFGFQAEDGWDLDSIKRRTLPRARFSPCQGTRRVYWVDAPDRPGLRRDHPEGGRPAALHLEGPVDFKSPKVQAILEANLAGEVAP